MFLYVIYITDDECFYVGMAHPGQSARKGNNYVPNDYRPFQCCPTKLERQTRVPKMSAQKLSHKKDSTEKKTHKSQFEFSSSSDSGSKKHDSKPTKTNDSKFGTTSPVSSSSSSSKRSSSNTANTASRGKKLRNDLDDDDDDVPAKDIKKSSKSKETNKPKPGQKGLLGIAKIVNWF